jgi:tRNA threonylcarbamoyladenosine biosynthesis protein TsaE
LKSSRLMKEIVIKDLSDIQSAAKELLGYFPTSHIFAFYGEMGVGKTTFIKAICKKLQVTDLVSSPTFGLVHEYHGKANMTIYHFDFYRMVNLQEIYDIGYEDYFFSGKYCFIEWPEIAESLLPPETIRLQINLNQDNSRTINSYFPDGRS